MDYGSGPYNVTIPSGVIITSFNVSITNDDTWEDTEAFFLIIRSESLPDGVISPRPTATIIILDDDCKE